VTVMGLESSLVPNGTDIVLCVCNGTAIVLCECKGTGILLCDSSGSGVVLFGNNWIEFCRVIVMGL
jgi:hypothetical protein